MKVNLKYAQMIWKFDVRKLEVRDFFQNVPIPIPLIIDSRDNINLTAYPSFSFKSCLVGKMG